jgi:hypothetical protein
MASGSDIILGVATAADGAKQRLALSRLEQLTRKVVASTEQSAPPSDPVADWTTQIRAAGAGTYRAAAPSHASSVKEAPDKKSEVYVQFEAVLLQNMVESMMPEDSQAMFGSGTAGSVWKSMLAEKVAAEIARSGVIGIAKQVAAAEAASQAAKPAGRPEGDDT